MAFIIPNATDTTSGNKYSALDQAEPDALDFEILGSRTSGVIYGCEVTAQDVANSTVRVSTGWVVLSNVAYPVDANLTLSLPSAPATGNRFDVVIARLSGAAMSLIVIPGTESAANPTFPKTSSRMVSTSGVDPLTYINPETDVVLATVYRSAGAAITSSRIVDKRAASTSGIRLQGSALPSSSVGSDGDLFFKSTLSVSDSSGVYVKRSGAWQELAKATVDPGVPVGTIIMWPGASSAPASASWVEADGSAVSRSTYSALFSVLGTTYGAGDGSTTFNLPDFRGQFLSGLPATGRAMGTRYGAANHSTTITSSNLPTHSHALSNNGVVSTQADHVHGINHDHPAASSSIANAHHWHAITNQTTDNTTVLTNQNWAFQQSAGASAWGYITSANLTSNTQSTGFNIPHNHTISGQTEPAGMNHNHSVDIPEFSGPSAAAGTHSHNLSGTTDNAGAGTAFSVEPSNYGIRFFLRYA